MGEVYSIILHLKHLVMVLKKNESNWEHLQGFLKAIIFISAS